MDTQKWFAEVVSSALENGVVSPDDIVRFVNPEIMAKELPPEVMSKVLATSMKRGEMSPQIFLEVVGADGLAEHIPNHHLWQCIEDGASKNKITE